VNPARAYNIDDLRVAARRRLPRVVFDYLEGGAEDHVSARANRESFESLGFAPRTLVDVSQRSLKTNALGIQFDAPFGISPIGAAGLFWHDAEVALARAARAAKLPFVLSTHAFVPVERVAFEAGGAPWFQLYMPPDRKRAEGILQRAHDAGCEALVLTTDVPVGGNREYNDRNGFGMPLRIGARAMADAALHPRWLAGVYFRSLWRRRLPHWGDRRDRATWADVAWLRKQWPRKLVVKGILGVEDARLALGHGADGICISNHGGRQLDGAPAPLAVLAEIAAAVGAHATVMIDGGVRRGADIVKALALGADLVFVGRAALYGVAAAGEPGVRRALQILRSEVERVMALLGCNSVEELAPEFLRSAYSARIFAPRAISLKTRISSASS
jgi:isopentenyl diphosphate isomerase/L-lactate dehydrogenase-like FMN-dependent dehydrogenase